MKGLKTILDKILKESQKIIMDYAIAEAKAKKEKAEIELETAKMQHQYAYNILVQETKGGNSNGKIN